MDDIREIDRFRNYAYQEKIRQLPIEQINELKAEAYQFYNDLKNKISFKRGLLKDPLTQLKDPLSDVTRKERKTLLTVSLVALLIMEIGLFPTKITSLEIEFDATNIKSFFFLIGLVIFYFIIAFGIYAWNDITKWRLEVSQAGHNLLTFEPFEFKDAISISIVVEQIDKLLSIQNQIDDLSLSIKKYSFFSIPRIGIEFVFPLLFASIVLIRSLLFDTSAHINSKKPTKGIDSLKTNSQVVDTVKNVKK